MLQKQHQRISSNITVLNPIPVTTQESSMASLSIHDHGNKKRLKGATYSTSTSHNDDETTAMDSAGEDAFDTLHFSPSTTTTTTITMMKSSLPQHNNSTMLTPDSSAAAGLAMVLGSSINNTSSNMALFNPYFLNDVTQNKFVVPNSSSSINQHHQQLLLRGGPSPLPSITPDYSNDTDVMLTSMTNPKDPQFSFELFRIGDFSF
jgi:hypothetical protein